MTAPAPSSAGDPAAEHRRTHPITPLVTGWKIVVGIIAVILAQNIASLVDEFTLTRALIGVGVLAVAVVVAVALSFVSWWVTTYAVTEEGVALHSGLISRSREFAPRARIESVSVERPLLARLLGLAKVRVEVAGGGESYLDIQYISAADAERLRQRILQVAALSRQDGDDAPVTEEGAGAHEAAAEPAGAATADGGDRLHEVLHDGVTDGQLIAEIPTGRLVHSLLRDADFLIGIIVSALGVVAAIAVVFGQEGISIAVLLPLLPTLIALPRYIFGRIEAGWGFVSRITDRGLRMRRGLANTRTDNIASGRIQRFQLRRPLLWRSQGWTGVTVTVAGIDDTSENGAENALPVGTAEELRLTLGHLAAPLGTADDLATIEHLLTARARDIAGMRAPHPVFWISRRTRVTVLLPGAVVHRSGIVSRKLEIVPRERIQQVTVEDGPFSRRLGVLDLQVGVAGHMVRLSDLARSDALLLHAVLAHDAATRRRYRDRAQWPRPALAAAPTGEER